MVLCCSRFHAEPSQLIVSFQSLIQYHVCSNLIVTSLQSWNLEEKLVYIVRDNASNFVAVLWDVDLSKIPCLAHTLQLVIDDGVLAQPCVVNLLAAGRRLVGHFKRSNNNIHALRRIQERLGLKKHRLIQDEPMHWNTSYYMSDTSH